MRAAGGRRLRGERRGAAALARIPTAFVQKQGRDAYLELLKNSRPYLEYLLDRSAADHDLNSDEGRRQFLTADAGGGGANSRSGGPRPVR